MKMFLPRFSIGKKLTVSGLACIVPMLILLHFMINDINARIRSARLEARGVRNLPIFHDLLSLFAEWEAAINEGDTDDQQNVNNRVEKLFEDLRKQQLTKPLDSDLHGRITRDIETLQRQWRDRARSGTDNAAATGQTLSRAAGEGSGLILDPDLDSYYLMEAVLLDVPAVLRRLGRLIESLRTPAGMEGVSQTQIAALQQIEGGRLVSALQTALEEDPCFYGLSPELQRSIPPLLTRFEEAMTQLQASRDGAQVNAAADAALYAAVELGREAARQLEILLDIRAATLVQRRWTALLLTGIAALAAAALMYFTCRSVTTTLRRSSEIASEISHGRISQARQHLPKELEEAGGRRFADEVWQLCRAMSVMTAHLDGLVTQVRDAASQVGSSSAQIGASAHQLEAAVTEQASGAQQVGVTTHEIAAQAEDLSSALAQAAAALSESASQAGQGKDGLVRINAVMQNVLGSAAEMNSKLQRAQEKTAGVDQVVTTITKIANQINLLSLNAAIEADKAGEYGAGFSIVAQEIQRLADQTAVSVLEIEELVTEMQQAVGDASATTAEFVSLAGSGGETVSTVSGSLQSLLDRVHELDPRFRSITDGMRSQADAAGQINATLQQLNETARQTAQIVSGYRLITGELSKTVAGLREKVSFFE